MIAFQKGTFRVLEPVTATLFAASPIEFVVNVTKITFHIEQNIVP